MGNINEGQAIERANYWIERLNLPVKEVERAELPMVSRTPYCSIYYRKFLISPSAILDLTLDELDFAIVNALSIGKTTKIQTIGLALTLPIPLLLMYLILAHRDWLFSWGLLSFFSICFVLLGSLVIPMRMTSVAGCRRQFEASLHETQNVEAARSCLEKASRSTTSSLPFPHPMFLSPKAWKRCLEQVVHESA